MNDDKLFAPAPLTSRHWHLARYAVLAAAALLFLVRLGDRAVVSEEVRWAEVAREMCSSGDYFHPTINGRIYYDKPVGSYWLIVAASYLTGGVNETAARLPAAVSGWLGVWLLIGLGRRLYDVPTAVLAGAILATSFGYTFYARRATADVETVVGVLAAVSLAVRFRDSPDRSWVLLLWVVMAVTSLTKGLLGVVLPGVVLAADTALRAFSSWRELGVWTALARHGAWLWNPFTLLGAPLAIGLYLLPFVLSHAGDGLSVGLEMVWRENVRRFVSPHNHTGPVTLYAGVIFVLAAPWSMFLPAALVPPGRRSEGDRFTRVYFWAVFAFFTISASRRGYYLLPVLPPAALLLARVLSEARAALGGVTRRLRDLGWGLFVIAIGLSGLGLLSPHWVLPAPYATLPPLPHRGFLAVGWLTIVAILALAFGNRGLRREWAAAVAAFAVLLAGFGLALPAADEYRTRGPFVAELRALTDTEPDRLALYRTRDIVFELGRTAPEFDDPAELGRAMQGGQIRWAVVRRRYLVGLEFPTRLVAEELVRPWEGEDSLGDKLVLIEAIVPSRP